MKHVSKILSLFVLVAGLTPVSAMAAPTANPVCNPQLARVRFMPEEPVIKPLLARGQESLTVEIKGGHNIYDPFTGRVLESAFTGSAYTMQPTSDGIRWGQDFPGIYQILIVPDEPSQGVFVNGISYPGAVAFYEADSRLAAVNWVSLDDFVSSMFSVTFIPTSGDTKEELAAYAIVLRSLAFQQIHAGESPFWDLSAEACGYRGNAIVRQDTFFKDAMRATKMIVMSNSKKTEVTPFTRKAIEAIRQQMPVADVQKLAKEGRDARVILHKYYPDQNLIVAGSKVVSNDVGEG